MKISAKLYDESVSPREENLSYLIEALDFGFCLLQFVVERHEPLQLFFGSLRKTANGLGSHQLRIHLRQPQQRVRYLKWRGNGDLSRRLQLTMPMISMEENGQTSKQADIASGI